MFVLDTNILVAALWSRRGASNRILELVLDGRAPIAVSVAVALEYEAVLKRKRFREVSWASDDELEILLDAILARASLIAPIRMRIRPTLRDPGDEMILECAVQAEARAIVTLNTRDFLKAKTVFGIAVIKPGEMLAQVLAGEDR